jgi:hypothetical protein
MSAEFLGVLEGAITIRISGRLTHPELTEVQRSVGDLISKQGKSRLLVLVEDFEGTTKEGNWGDFSFQQEYDPMIEKIALVGDKKWEDMAYLFTGKGVRRVAIQYFPSADLAKARAWLLGKS